jgi:hypothetical protein
VGATAVERQWQNPIGRDLSSDIHNVNAIGGPICVCLLTLERRWVPFGEVKKCAFAKVINLIFLAETEDTRDDREFNVSWKQLKKAKIKRVSGRSSWNRISTTHS